MNKLLTIIIAACICALAGGLCRAQDSEAPPKGSTETPHFVIIFDPDDAGRVPEVARMAETAYDEVVGLLGVAPRDKVDLYIYGSRRRFSALLTPLRRDSLLGTYTKEPLGPGTIVVDVSNALEWAPKIITHEFTHAVVAAATEKGHTDVPLWFNEGLAVYTSDRYNPVLDDIVERAMLQGQLFTFDEISATFPSDQQFASIAYAQSYSIVKRITWGRKKQHALSEIMTNLAAGLTFDQALTKATGRSEEHLIQDWEKSVRRKSTWLRFWSVLPEILFSLMGVLFLVAFATTMLRRRREYREKYKWEMEFEPDAEPEEPWED